jgi:hypothetical protein
VNPVNGETWIHTLGAPDTTFFTAKFYKEQHTLCGTFNNVYGFTLTNMVYGNIDTILTPFYAENIGYIGTDWNNNRQPNVRASYIKVSNKEYGSLLPLKNGLSLGSSKMNNSNRLRLQFAVMFTFLGAQTPANQALKLTK